MTRKTLPLVEPGDVVREFTSTEVATLVAQWLDAFGANRDGVNAKAYLWHIFSGGRYPSLSGEVAREEYVKQIGAEFVVLSNNRKTAFVTNALPQNSSLVDYYVFPANLAWTMAFTHEEGWLGPYFARHRDFDVLNEVNVRKLRKLQQSEEARVKGWL
jgi:hypothetical protein